MRGTIRSQRSRVAGYRALKTASVSVKATWLAKRLSELPRRTLGAIRLAKHDNGGAAAIEFAIVGSTFIAVLLTTLFLFLLMFLNQSLDYATSKAARQIMTGVVQTGAMTQASFRTSVVCSYLSAAFKCDDVIVNVQTVKNAAQPSGYYTLVKSDQTGLLIPALSNGSTQFDLGVQGSYVYLQVMYPLTQLPTLFTNLFSPGITYNGNAAYLLVSTIAFRNEQY